MTFCGPVQSGKSAIGEIAVCYWIATQNGGDVQYNWQNDESADGRWSKRVEKILLACPAVMDRTSTDRFKWKKGLVIFPHCNLTMQGVNTDRNVASDSIRFQVNEEIHDEASGWAPGKLQQCYNRTTAFWNSVIFNISNAGHRGDQLHQAFEAGTQQHWEVKCPGCGQYHRMRTKWEDNKPELGGLRYESSKTEKGEYDYQRIAPTVRYQFPCGAVVQDDLVQRRRLSLSGRYSVPLEGRSLSERSFTLEAVSVDYIPWLSLIQEKHRALKAYHYGDRKPLFDYLRERECQFVDDADGPVTQTLILSDRKKDRAGLPEPRGRCGALDYQAGSIGKGELQHYWGVIQDFKWEPIKADEALSKALCVPVGSETQRLHILTVWEGKLLTDEDAAEVMRRHDVDPLCVIVDSGYDAEHIYKFCLRHGFDAVKGEDKEAFSHGEQQGYKIYSPSRPIHERLECGRTRATAAEEPQIFQYSTQGMMRLLSHLRASPGVLYDVPGDVSEDYKQHMASWEPVEAIAPRTGQTKTVWKQIGSRRDDLLFCSGYCALVAYRGGIIGMGAEPSQP